VRKLTVLRNSLFIPEPMLRGEYYFSDAY